MFKSQSELKSGRQQIEMLGEGKWLTLRMIGSVRVAARFSLAAGAQKPVEASEVRNRAVKASMSVVGQMLSSRRISLLLYLQNR